jgi:hypothetical protein
MVKKFRRRFANVVSRRVDTEVLSVHVRATCRRGRRSLPGKPDPPGTGSGGSLTVAAIHDPVDFPPRKASSRSFISPRILTRDILMRATNSPNTTK